MHLKLSHIYFWHKSEQGISITYRLPLTICLPSKTNSVLLLSWLLVWTTSKICEDDSLSVFAQLISPQIRHILQGIRKNSLVHHHEGSEDDHPSPPFYDPYHTTKRLGLSNSTWRWNSWHALTNLRYLPCIFKIGSRCTRVLVAFARRLPINNHRSFAIPRK